jgi:hypothetical protein
MIGLLLFEEMQTFILLFSMCIRSYSDLKIYMNTYQGNMYIQVNYFNFLSKFLMDSRAPVLVTTETLHRGPRRSTP